MYVWVADGSSEGDGWGVEGVGGGEGEGEVPEAGWLREEGWVSLTSGGEDGI